MAHVPEAAWAAHDSDVIEMDDSARTAFTFANNTNGESLRVAGVPHPLCYRKHQGCWWFALVETSSPTARSGQPGGRRGERDTRWISGFGRRSPLTRLKSGHWGLPQDSDSKGRRGRPLTVPVCAKQTRIHLCQTSCFSIQPHRRFLTSCLMDPMRTHDSHHH